MRSRTTGDATGKYRSLMDCGKERASTADQGLIVTSRGSRSQTRCDVTVQRKIHSSPGSQNNIAKNFAKALATYVATHFNKQVPVAASRTLDCMRFKFHSTEFGFHNRNLTCNLFS
jgi:hypothetical protein